MHFDKAHNIRSAIGNIHNSIQTKSQKENKTTINQS